MISKHTLECLRERIQDDITCVLDGLDDEIITNVCQCVVDRINDLIKDEYDEV